MHEAPPFFEQAFSRMPPGAEPMPLVVDLDGGLLQNDPARIVINAALLAHPVGAVREGLLRTGRHDRSALRVARHWPDLMVSLPVNPDVVDLMQIYGRFGGQIAVITRADAGMAERVVTRLRLRAQIYGSDRGHFMSDLRKARVLQALYGPHGFLYVGGVRVQEAVCMMARRAILVDMPERLRARLLTHGVAASVLPPPIWHSARMRVSQMTGAAESDGMNQKVSREMWEAARTPGAPAEAQATRSRPTGRGGRMG